MFEESHIVPKWIFNLILSIILCELNKIIDINNKDGQLTATVNSGLHNTDKIYINVSV